MAKPALFWTLKPHWYSGGFTIMRVTSEKRVRVGSHYYGSDENGMPTHVEGHRCKGRFETREDAEAMIAKVAAVVAAHADNHAILTAARNAAERLEREEIAVVLAGGKPTPPKNPLEITRAALAKGAERCRQLVRMGNG
jgi:hypothetical protein